MVNYKLSLSRFIRGGVSSLIGLSISSIIVTVTGAKNYQNKNISALTFLFIAFGMAVVVYIRSFDVMKESKGKKTKNKKIRVINFKDK